MPLFSAVGKWEGGLLRVPTVERPVEISAYPIPAAPAGPGACSGTARSPVAVSVAEPAVRAGDVLRQAGQGHRGGLVVHLVNRHRPRRTAAVGRMASRNSCARGPPARRRAASEAEGVASAAGRRAVALNTTGRRKPMVDHPHRPNPAPGAQGVTDRIAIQNRARNGRAPCATPEARQHRRTVNHATDIH